ncbi:BQ2448_5111 [Microbotryum intermedium]|uniref:BQ2448_5111 protein n=1 Tax=Microbotryum intermedium TaxID=269621 RepID=A0A238F050_9BASI|nr:BQ2448_5111 [Microbotryum intermedium]
MTGLGNLPTAVSANYNTPPHNPLRPQGRVQALNKNSPSRVTGTKGLKNSVPMGFDSLELLTECRRHFLHKMVWERANHDSMVGQFFKGQGEEELGVDTSELAREFIFGF